MSKKVLVAMSGGVDSSVAAFLLKQQGYNCTAATMILTNDYNKEELIEELADVQAYCIMMAEKLDVDLEQIVLDKYKNIKMKIKINENFNFVGCLLIVLPIIIFSIIFDMDDVNVYHIILILFIYFSYFVVLIGNTIKKIIK